MTAVRAQIPVAGNPWVPVSLGTLVVVAVLATALPAAMGTPPDSAYAIASKVALSALAVVLLSGLHWWRRAGFLALPSRADLRWLALPSILVLGALGAVIAVGPATSDSGLVLAFAVVAIGTGFSEEALFRGALVEAMRPWGAVRTIIGTTVAFSLLHLAGIMGGATLEATLVQVLLGGLPFGLAFAGLRLTTRSIWPLIGIHAVNNFTSLLMSGQWQAVTQDTSKYAAAGTASLGLLIVLALYGAWFLWRFTRGQRERSDNAPSPTGSR